MMAVAICSASSQLIPSQKDERAEGGHAASPIPGFPLALSCHMSLCSGPDTEYVIAAASRQTRLQGILTHEPLSQEPDRSPEIVSEELSGLLLVLVSVRCMQQKQ